MARTLTELESVVYRISKRMRFPWWFRLRWRWRAGDKFIPAIVTGSIVFIVLAIAFLWGFMEWSSEENKGLEGYFGETIEAETIWP